MSTPSDEPTQSTPLTPQQQLQERFVARRRDRHAHLQHLPCVVDGVTVDVVVCWNAEQLEATRQKWPDGVDIAALERPGYQGFGSAEQRLWLTQTARKLAAAAAKDATPKKE